MRKQVGSIFIRNDNCTGRVWERGQSQTVTKGLAQRQKVPPAKVG